jgi:glutathione peroxidase
MRILIVAVTLALGASAPEAQDKKKKDVPLPPDSFYGLSTKTLEGQPAALKDYAGKVALVINVASQCGNTPQYTGLENLYEELKDKGFVILAFPSNDFGGQEPGTPKEIRDFCTSKYKVSFPIFEKVVTKAGKDQSPLYANLSKQAGGSLPEWNFSKYLVAKNGKVIKFYKAGTKPDAPELRTDIDAALAAK